MSEIEKLPPAVQQRLLRLQQLQQTLQNILAQKQQIELETIDIEQALAELEKTSDQSLIYKSVGSLLVKTEKQNITKDLKEKKELDEMRLNVFGKQEERLRSQIKDLSEKLEKDLRPISPA